MTLDQIRARHNDWVDSFGEPSGERLSIVGERKALLAAIDAVLALHTPDGSQQPECVACRVDCLYCEGQHDYPCPTVTAINTALGETP